MRGFTRAGWGTRPNICAQIILSSQGHCILMRLMFGRVKLRLSVLHSIIIMANLFNCCGVLTRGHEFNDFAKSHHNLTYQTAQVTTDLQIIYPSETPLTLCKCRMGPGISDNSFTLRQLMRNYHETSDSLHRL